MMNYEDLLIQMLQGDDRYIILTAENRAAIRGLPQKIGNRFIDTGIAEQTMVGMAAGLALRGRIPVIHALTTFLTMRAFEFIRTDIGIGQLPVKLVGYIPGFLSEANGPTHQALEDIAIMRAIPGMRIFSPADNQDLLAGLTEILPDPHPWYIRYVDRPPIVSHDTSFIIGEAEWLKEGTDLAILAHGLMTGIASDVASRLKSEDISVSLLNMRTIQPVDEESVLKAAQKSQFLMVIEDHFRTGGLYSIVAEILVRRRINCPVLAITMENRWFKPTLLNQVLEYEGFTAEQLTHKIKQALATMENFYAE